MTAKRVFITGGAGFIGSNVVRQLVRDGHDVCVYDSFVVYIAPTSERPSYDVTLRLKDLLGDIRLVRGSTLNKDFLRRQLSDFRPDAIIHMAAMPIAALAIEHTEEAFQSILNSTQNLLEIMRDMSHPCRLTYVSSSMVYGDFKSAVVDEHSHPKDPKDIYGAFKLAGETIVTAYAKNYDIDYTICRPSAVYGPFDTNLRVVQKFVTNALAGKPLVLEGDGSSKLDFTYVEDSARAIGLASLHPDARGQIFNVTRGEGRTLRELVSIIEGAVPGVIIQHKERPAFMPERGSLSIDRARRILGYEPLVPLESGVQRYIEHLRKNPF